MFSLAAYKIDGFEFDIASEGYVDKQLLVSIRLTELLPHTESCRSRSDRTMIATVQHTVSIPPARNITVWRDSTVDSTR